MTKILPVKRSKAQAQHYYDRISQIYDRLTVSEAVLIERGSALLAIQPGETLLEIGCGTGRALGYFAKSMLPDGVHIGLDLSRRMLLHCQAKPILPAPLLIQGDGVCLPFRDNSFHVIFMAFTLELFTQQDMHAVLAECWRVLKQDGRLGVVALGAGPRSIGLRLYELAHRLFPVAVDCRPIPLTALLETNGYRVIQSEMAINWGLPIQITVSTKRSSKNLLES